MHTDDAAILGEGMIIDIHYGYFYSLRSVMVDCFTGECKQPDCGKLKLKGITFQLIGGVEGSEKRVTPGQNSN